MPGLKRDSGGATVEDVDSADVDGAVSGLAYREVVEPVAVEVSRSERGAEEVSRLDQDVVAQDGVGEPGLESGTQNSVTHDHEADVFLLEAGEPVVVGNSGREVVRAVAVEVAGGEGGAESVVRLGNEEQQVLVLEVLRADRGEADPARALGEGGWVGDDREGDHRDHQGAVPDKSRHGGQGLDSHSNYA